LVDIRENVKLRSVEHFERQEGTALVARRKPYRMDCHYLLVASSNPGGGPPPPPPLQHSLLYEATTALVRCSPLIPAKVYPPGSTELEAWSEDSRDMELPMTVNPHEGFPKLAEFWGTLAAPHPWRALIYVVVTIPVEHRDDARPEIVRRRTTIYRAGVQSESIAEIGGSVIGRDLAPVGRAWVSAGIADGSNREELARTTSDDEGQFVLSLPEKATHLWAAAYGMGVTPALDVVSNAKNDFTLKFT
jgi:hypothetical protein